MRTIITLLTCNGIIRRNQQEGEIFEEMIVIARTLKGNEKSVLIGRQFAVFVLVSCYEITLTPLQTLVINESTKTDEFATFNGLHKIEIINEKNV